MMAQNEQDSRLQQAEAIKAEANALFKDGKYQEAYDKYTEAIEVYQNEPTYYTNRAMASLRLENYGDVIADAEKALNVKPGFVKAYYRRASAYFALGRYKESLKDFRVVVKGAPNDADAKQKLSIVEKIVKRIDFEKAMAYDDVVKPKISETINPEDFVVEDSYDGVKWDEGDVTPAFVRDLVTRFEKEKRIHKKYALKMMLKALDILKAQKSVVDIDLNKYAPGTVLTVCGDIHGQYYDLLNIFKTNGYPSDGSDGKEPHIYLFNGDFVDRGSFSVECIMTLLAYKVLYPEYMLLNRGNHETDDMNRMYGFENELRAKYQSDNMFKLFSEIFCACPLAHLIHKKALVLHGGLFSRDNVSIDELRDIDRFRQPPPSVSGPSGKDLLMVEMLWSDPCAEMGRQQSKRGVAIQFGPDVTKNFCDFNGLDMIIRSHEVKDNGYAIDHNGRCVTVFSAPNYCDQMDNKGAYINITVDNGDRSCIKYEYCTFDAVPHPMTRPMQYVSFGNMMGLV
ncbi:hypothetical protein MP228_004835 [Amoeboaphelidium protococcarum]|nr:hypothetical protein MP228_004835 [Amoeboaphelidium protococcarum]